MKPIVFGESVQGASHKRVNKECQDSCKQLSLGDTLFLAVADGHGSEACPYSKSGSQIAVNVFCKIMYEYCLNYKNDMDMLLTYLNREGETKIAQSIDKEWKRRVLKAHTDNKRGQIRTSDGDKDKVAIYRQYGSTLTGLMITPKFIFAYQLGDGDIVYLDEDGLEPVITSEKILGVETHSLSKVHSWKNATTLIKRREQTEAKPCAFMLTSDGFVNSYTTQVEYQKTCKEYFIMIQEHGPEVVASNLRNWLTETSEMGCGDDITMLCAYFPNS